MNMWQGQYANLNLAVVNAANATTPINQGDYMCVAIDRYGNGSTTVHNFEGNLVAYNGGQRSDTGLLEIVDSAVDGALRISFNSATKVLTSSYSTDGTNWHVVQTQNISTGTYNWNMTDSSTFCVMLVGGSGGVSLNSGQAYFSNFQASTVIPGGGMLDDWNDDGIISIIGDVPPFINAVYFQNYPAGWSQEKLLQVGDCNHDGILSIIGDVPCFVNCVYFQQGCSQ
jgi:hypothetical protein